MAQNYAEMPQPARQLVWKYWSITEDALEKEFYVALQAVVASVIRDQLASSLSQRLWVGREISLSIGQYKLRARLTIMEPLLSNTFDANTAFLAQFRERSKDERQDISSFIAEIIRYPDERLGATYNTLIGLDDIKKEMEQRLRILLNPQVVDRWFQLHYGSNTPIQLAQTLRDRYPLVILEGEVGCGKTILARSIGHVLAKEMRSVVLFVVNAQVRGGGHVGELTQNISRAFDEAERCQEQEQVPVMILIDEADALAQTRGSRQTHHEDDAGVNTLIQRVDRLRGRPMAVIFATNLFRSLDSAIIRRASAYFHFERPDFEHREEMFRRLVGPIGINKPGISDLAIATNPRELPDYDGKFHRYTFSDISQRILPYAVEYGMDNRSPLSLEYLLKACERVLPTPETVGIDRTLLEACEKYFEFGHFTETVRIDRVPPMRSTTGNQNVHKAGPANNPLN